MGGEGRGKERVFRNTRPLRPRGRRPAEPRSAIYTPRVAQWRTQNAHTHTHAHNLTHGLLRCVAARESGTQSPKSGNRMMKEVLTSWKLAGNTTRRTQSVRQNPNDSQGGGKIKIGRTKSADASSLEYFVYKMHKNNGLKRRGGKKTQMHGAVQQTFGKIIHARTRARAHVHTGTVFLWWPWGN